MDDTLTAKNWKRLWLKAAALTGRMTVTLYRRTKLLVAVFEDAEFRADNDLRDDEQIGDYIDDHFPPLGLTFLQLRYLLQRYPKESQWKGANLAGLYAGARAADSAGQEESNAQKRTSTRITKAQYEEACRDRDHWKARSAYLSKQVAELRAKLDAAQDSIVDQRARIDELQGMLTSELVSV